jgi:hypothetical protein
LRILQSLNTKQVPNEKLFLSCALAAAKDEMEYAVTLL